MRYLSDAWIAAATEALDDYPPAPSPLGIGYRVGGGPDGDRQHTIVLSPDGARVVSGLEPADLVFDMAWPVATAIAQGERSAQRAFLDGEITVDGDATQLLSLGPYWSGLQDRLVELRSNTEY